MILSRHYNTTLHRGNVLAVARVLAALIYEHVTCNVNSTDLTVNNAHTDLYGPDIYLSQSIKLIPAGCAAV